MDEHRPWAPPNSPPPFTVPPGRSVVIPDDPPSNRKLVVVTCVAVCLLLVAAVVVAAIALTNDSDGVTAQIDSAATPTSVPSPPTTTPSTTTTYLPQGGVKFLATRSEISARSLKLDFSRLSAGTCFNVVHELNHEPEPKPIDCAEPHYYQLYAIGLVPNGVTDYSEVDDLARNYCHDAFLRFVDHWWYPESHFTFSWNPPEESEFPESRTNYCFLEVPGDYAWTGDAEGSGA